MSSYTVIGRTSEALQAMLVAAFTADANLNNAVFGDANADPKPAISFENPTDTDADKSLRLSVWLYQVTENEFVKNQPMLRANGHGELRLPPLTLNLYYLITPFTGNRLNDHQLLGKILQVFYDHAIVYLPDQGDGVVEELRITLCRLTLEELTRIWEALREPYRLSVCYQVRVCHIESQRVVGAGRVLESIGEYQSMPATPAKAVP